MYGSVIWGFPYLSRYVWELLSDPAGLGFVVGGFFVSNKGVTQCKTEAVPNKGVSGEGAGFPHRTHST